MKIAFYTLGCKVNQYESEALRERFLELGWESAEAEEHADVYVVNTCTVTGMSDRKSRQYIRRMKRQNPDCITAVIGCYAQVSPEEAAAVEGVDLVLGTAEKADLPQYVLQLLDERKAEKSAVEAGNGTAAPRKPLVAVSPRKALKKYRENGEISAMEDRTRAFIKIQEGCDRFCTYCVIPYARGPVRSRDPESVLREAQKLLNQGFKEFVLAGINTALYGTEEEFWEDYGTLADGTPFLKEGEQRTSVSGLELLLYKLSQLPGDFRIRLSSLEPTVVNKDEALRLLAYPKLCHHLHLSLQSGSDAVLKAMNRRYNMDEYRSIVSALRQQDPGYGISTDIIVGFPGETEEDFLGSCRAAEDLLFVKSHVFPYSQRKGTPAADFPNQIAPQTKKERAARLSLQGEAVAKAFCSACCGTVRQVLWERCETVEGKTYCTGYADNYIKVYLPCLEEEGKALENTFSDVLLLESFREGVLGKQQR